LLKIFDGNISPIAATTVEFFFGFYRCPADSGGAAFAVPHESKLFEPNSAHVEISAFVTCQILGNPRRHGFAGFVAERVRTNR
jgi:hypothetical protein